VCFNKRIEQTIETFPKYRLKTAIRIFIWKTGENRSINFYDRERE